MALPEGKDRLTVNRLSDTFITRAGSRLASDVLQAIGVRPEDLMLMPKSRLEGFEPVIPISGEVQQGAPTRLDNLID